MRTIETSLYIYKRKRALYMYSIEFIRFQENKYDSFCRAVIKNAALDFLRSRKRRQERFSSLEELESSSNQTVYEDIYRGYTRKYYVKGIEIPIHDERIGELLQFILPKHREVLLLSYFKDYTDMDISRLLGISHKTVAYRKKAAIKKLKFLLEVLDLAQKQD